MHTNKGGGSKKYSFYVLIANSSNECHEVLWSLKSTSGKLASMLQL